MRDTAPFWSLADLVSERTPPGDLQVSLEDMVSGTGRLIDGGLSRYDANGTPFVEGDVLFGKLRPYLAKYWLADRPGTAGGDIHVYHPSKDVEPRFLNYIVGSRDFVRYAQAASKGVKMPRTEWMGLREFRVYRPGLPAQQRIADYLDRETGEIDAMIARMDELAETLGVRRQAVVDGSFVDDFTERSAAVHLLADVTVGIVIEPSKLYVRDGQGVPALRGINVAQGQIRSADMVRISHDGHARNRKSALQEGDLVTVRTGQAGVTAVVPAEWSGANAIDLVITRPRNTLNSRYLYWFLSSSLAKDQMNAETVGAVQSHFNVGGLRRLRMPVVDPGQQQRIADHLDEVTGRIDAMLAKVAELKSLLAERRAAIITDVVTGRKDVA